MITITSPLSRQTVVSALPGQDFYEVQLQATITETNPALNLVAASLNWDDGSAPVQFGPVVKPLVINVTRSLYAGTYYFTLTAWNYQSFPPVTTASYFNVEIQPAQPVPQALNYLFGPILPKDNGSPNAETWNFNLGYDLDVLASSVKMILITTKGERIMNPNYGTLLRQAIFEPNDNTVTSFVKQEITDALSQFEPRVSLVGINVKRISPRELAVNAQFMSKIGQNTFVLSLPLAA
jgi:phage baseplate assembly protein W